MTESKGFVPREIRIQILTLPRIALCLWRRNVTFWSLFPYMSNPQSSCMNPLQVLLGSPGRRCTLRSLPTV